MLGRETELFVPKSQLTQSLRLVVFGGGGKLKKRLNDIWIFDTVAGRWSKCDSLNERPAARTYHTAEILNQFLLIFGGENQGEMQDLVVFDLEKKLWYVCLQFTQASRKPAEISSPAASSQIK